MKGLWHGPRGTLAGVTECILAYGTRIYTVRDGGSEWFLRYKALNEVKRVCQAPKGTPCQCHWMCFSIRKMKIYGLGVWIRMVSEILGFLLNKGGRGMAPGSPRLVSLDVS